jgi:hypothetical protein
LEQRETWEADYVEALRVRRWGGAIPEKAARLEIQIRRPKLVEFGIDNIADLQRNVGSVIQWAMTDYFRLTSDAVDSSNKHQGRAEMLPLWLSLLQAMQAVHGKLNGPLVPLDRAKIAPLKLWQQSRGSAAAALLQMGVNPDNYDDLLFATVQGFYKLGRTPEERAKYIAEYKRRLTEYAA